MHIPMCLISGAPRKSRLSQATLRNACKAFLNTLFDCKCTLEVFDSIAIERAPTPDAALSYTRLVIGNRLLMHVFEAQSSNATAAAVPKLARQGRAERDAQHFNRYRLVVASAHPTQLLKEARTGFASVAGPDNRAHLHILAIDQLPDALCFGVNEDVGATVSIVELSDSCSHTA